MKYVLLATVLLIGCASQQQATKPEVDPTTDPSAIGAVTAAVQQGSEESAAGADTGRRIGRVVGVIAAITGGPQSESIDDAIARYRDARDLGESIGAAAGAAKGANAGARRGFAFDKQMAELEKITELDVTRPAPYVIVVRFDDPQSGHLDEIARIVSGREIDIVAAGDTSTIVRDALIGFDIPASTLQAHRNDEERGVTLHIFMGDR
ncbi:MAG TPA: hypothetical protein VMU84_01490 [Thermoanaerobaculia bacterium]|nr:hypothetical protein [Thermoanaerobaculia bacterium]